MNHTKVAFPGRVIFDHIHKTAGQAVNNWLVSQLGSACVTPNLSGRHIDLIRRYGGEFSVISAHIEYSGESFDPRYQYVTVFREPLDRALSWVYFLYKNFNAQHFNDIPLQNNYWYEAKDFIESEGEVLGPQLYKTIVNPYVHHLSSVVNVLDISESQSLETAKQVIDSYSVWGLYEKLPEFINDLSQMIGISNKSALQTINVTRERLNINELSVGFRNRLENLLSLDIQFYEYLNERWRSRVVPQDIAQKSNNSWLPYEKQSRLPVLKADAFELLEAKINGSSRIVSGELIEFKLLFYIFKEVGELEVGIHIHDKIGELALGTNSTMLSKNLSSPSVGVNSVSFSLVAHFPSGEYKAGFAFATTSHSSARVFNNIAWFDPFVEFQVSNVQLFPCVGYLNLSVNFSHEQFNLNNITQRVDSLCSIVLNSASNSLTTATVNERLLIPVLLMGHSNNSILNSLSNNIYIYCFWRCLDGVRLAHEEILIPVTDISLSQGQAREFTLAVNVPSEAGMYEFVALPIAGVLYNACSGEPLKIKMEVVSPGASRFFDALDFRLHSLVGIRDTRSIVGGHESGCVLFGPYSSLRAGRWLARLNGFLDPIDKQIFIDVVVQAGTICLSMLDVTNPVTCAEIAFDLNNDVNDLEVRLHCTIGSVVRVDSIILLPILD